MPKKKSGSGVGGDDLRELLRRGIGTQSEVLKARLQYGDVEGLLKFVRALDGKETVHPSMLPTQASLRWSTTEPPIVNTAKDDKAIKRGLPPLRRMFVPFPGEWMLAFDLDAIEAKIVAGYSGDEEDIEAFNKNFDVHTITCCQMFGWERPPLLTKAGINKAPESAKWRQAHEWGGTDDIRRVLAKTARYSLGYGPNEYAILNAPGVEEMNMPKERLLKFAKQYLAAKPRLRAWKQRTWEECRRTGIARTFLGHRRKLFGGPDERAQAGLNHMVQGAVAGMMDLTIIALVHPERGEFGRVATLGLNAHDGAKLFFPDSEPPDKVIPVAKQIVERAWTIGGHDVVTTAEWEIVRPDGSKEPVR